MPSDDIRDLRARVGLILQKDIRDNLMHNRMLYLLSQPNIDADIEFAPELRVQVHGGNALG